MFFSERLSGDLRSWTDYFANQAGLPVRALCKTLKVSTSRYYDWRGRPLSQRGQDNVVLSESIRQAHRSSDETYGMPRIRAELDDAGINALWVADMTYVPTWEGFLDLAVLIDAGSRKVVGWAFGVQMTADLVLSALNIALHSRRHESVIHHSDQGSQYTSIAFGNRCREMGVRRSMGTVGDADDNGHGRELLCEFGV